MRTLFLLCLLPLATLVSLSSDARVIEKIFAIVNDEIITQTDMQRFRSKLSSGGLVDDAVIRLADPKVLLKDEKALINHLIDERLLDSEVKRKGLSVTVEKIEQEIRNITRRNGISRAQLKSALAEKGVKFSEYQDFIRTSLERQSLIEKEVSSKIKISDDDVSSYYVTQMGDKNANIFEFTLAHILFLPKQGEKEARNRAKLVESKLKSGSMTFEKLASQFSEDPNFSQGGVLGTFKAGEMLPEMEQAVKGMSVGDTTGIIKTRVGLHLVKLLKKTLVPNPAFEARKEELRGLLFGQAFKKQFRNWLDDRRRDSFIRIN
ncbi:MAG: peptidylprolyl isomerase [Bdellovibrionaceae bacterium]|nr:peptidylprolyl isomerase [Bdellovibrionales bacterium]MCB9085440.1 peptidylprolyl isomerase [Pseudobdellovibrionaceae bacterium]